MIGAHELLIISCCNCLLINLLHSYTCLTLIKPQVFLLSKFEKVSGNSGYDKENQFKEKFWPKSSNFKGRQLGVKLSAIEGRPFY